ncbi:putative Site-specific integrase [uncultured Thiomicrorhabdus sp.]
MIHVTNTGFKIDLNIQGYPRLRRTVRDREVAITVEARLKAAMYKGKPWDYILSISDPTRLKTVDVKESNGILWENMIPLVEAHYSGSKNERHAIGNAKQVIETIGRYVPVETITDGTVEALITSFKAQGNSNKTINRKLTSLSVMLKMARKRGYIESIPTIERLKESGSRVHYYTDEMVDSFIGNLKGTSYSDMVPYFLFLLDTGCRVTEALKATTADINEGNSVTFRETKGGRSRTIPLTLRQREYIKGLEDGPLFPTVTYDRIRTSFTLVGRDKLKWPGEYVVHTFRHTCATRLVQKGVHIVDVKEWLGHSNIQTTMIYIQFAKDHLSDALKKLEGF